MWKNVAPGRAQTCTSCSVGECPNHIDHPLYSLCFQLILMIYVKGSSLFELSLSLSSELEFTGLHMWPYMQAYPFYSLVYLCYLVELVTTVLHEFL